MRAKKRKKKAARAKAAKVSGSEKKVLRAAKKKSAKAKSAKKPVRRKKKVTRRGVENAYDVALRRPQIYADKAGQSGDVQGLSEEDEADSESVVELAEEGQDFEAEVVDGVENARDPDQGEVRTHEVPEDDVPEEYRNPEQSFLGNSNPRLP